MNTWCFPSRTGSILIVQRTFSVADDFGGAGHSADRETGRKMKSQYVCFAGAILVVASGFFPAAAAPVSATPGIIKGVVHFNAPFVPDSMEVDAQDVTHTYNATATASQNDPVSCAPGSQNWCYSVTVESALAHSYYLRPIARVAHNSPVFVQARIPFPPTAAAAIAVGPALIQDL